MAETYTSPPPKNSLALVSLIASITGWVLTLIFACLNIILIQIIAGAALAVGFLVYLCLIPLFLIPPLAWFVGVIAGHTALNKIKISGEAGERNAIAGLIMGWIGLGLTILGLCASLGLILTGGTVPILDEIMRTW